MNEVEMVLTAALIIGVGGLAAQINQWWNGRHR